MIYFVDGLLWVIAIGLGLIAASRSRHLLRDSVREGLATALKQRADQSGGQVPERLASTIKSMENYDVQEFQTTTLRLADGWPDTMTVEHQSIIGPERRFKRTVATRLP